MRIIDELVGFCCRHGGRNIDVNINFENENSVLTIKSSNVTVSKDDFELLNSQLSANRQHEMEECYWQLSGEDNFGEELSLIGYMTDKCKIEYDKESKNLTFIVSRKE